MPVSMFHTYMGSLLELKQTGTVVEYTAVFWERLHPVLDLDPSLSIKSFVHQYVEGLRDDIQAAVRSRSPSSITGASSLARIREDEIGKDAMGADKVGVSDGLMPKENFTDVFPEPVAPVQCRESHNVTTLDVSCRSALTLTTSLMECPSSDATVDDFPKLAASMESDKDLDLNTISVAALASATYSTGGLAHGRDSNNPVAVSLVLWTMTPSSTACPPPSPVRSFFARGSLLWLQPKPPWVSSSQALLSKGRRYWEHLYISGNLNLLASCWNFSSPELPLYGIDWIMVYGVTDLVVQKNWDPGGMLQSGSAHLASPRCFCLAWDPCLTEANHYMKQLRFHKFGSVCKATYTATHQLDPRILVSIFHVHSVGTLKFVMVRQYPWKVQVIDYLLFGVKEWVQDIQRVQPISVVYHAPAVWCEQLIAGTPLQVLVNASVLELRAREWCMADVSADFRLKWEFRLTSDQGQGEQFTCGARKLLEVQCCIFSLSIVMESLQCPSINVLEFFCCNIWWILEVTLWLNDSDIAELACCTHLCKIDGVHPSSSIWVHMGVFRLAVAGQFLTAPYVIQSMRYVATTHYLGTSTLLSSECVSGLFVPAVRCSLDHGSDFNITRTMSDEFPVENKPPRTYLCIFVCGIRLWNPGIFHLIPPSCWFLRSLGADKDVNMGSEDFVVLGLEHLRELYKGKFNLIQVAAMIVSFDALTCTCERAYFSGRQWDCDIVRFIPGTLVLSKLKLIAVYFVLELECDIKLGYLGHLTVMVMLQSSLFWCAYWLTYRVQPAENYMKLPPDNIAQALLELYSSFEAT